MVHSFLLCLLFSQNFQLPKGCLNGYTIYGLRGNYESLGDYFYHIVRILLKMLNRRSQHKSYTWTSFGELLKDFPLAKPRICHPF